MTQGVPPQIQLRRLTENLDYLRIPLNAEQRASRAGDVPYWGANSIVDYLDHALVDQPVILVGEDGAPFFEPFRDVAFAVEGPIWPNNHIHVLRPRPGVDHRYVAYALNSVDYSLYVRGSTRDKLNQSALASIELPAWHPEQQRDIADYLDHETAEIDAFISDLGILSALSREHTSARIARLMTREAHSGEFRESQLGHVIQINQGQVDPRLDKFAAWPLIAPNHIESRTGRLLEISSAGEQGAESGKYVAKPGQVLYSKIRPALMKAIRLDFSALCSADMYPIDANPRWLSNDYLLEYLLAPEFESFAVTMSERVAMPKLNRETLSRAPIVLPDLSVQGKIVTAVREVREKHLGLQEEASKAISTARERRAALISAAVTGQIDVSQRHKPLAEKLEGEVLQKT